MSQPFVSYAQNYEDVMLNRALAEIKNGFYIDIGAWDPVNDSVTMAFYTKGWRGINVEPHPHYFEKLQQNRPRDINLECAISDKKGTVDLHIIGDTGLSTVDLGFSQKHANSLYGKCMSLKTVPSRTLDSVWQEHVPDSQPVHFLKIDSEGAEEAIIRGTNWSSHRPWILVIEATEPMSQIPNYASWEPELLNSGYRFVYFDGLSRFYVAVEHPQLIKAFEAPPNVFDGFQTYASKQLEAQLSQVHEKLLQIDAQLNAERQRSDLLSAFAEIQRQLSYLNRSFWEKLLIRPDGKPKRLLRRFLFHVSGKPRGIFRQFFMHKDGRPSRLFRDWILSPEYQRLPRALYPVIQAEDSTGAPLLSPRTQYFLERLNRKTHN